MSLPQSTALTLSPASGRSWANPTHPWVMRMQWHDLLFAHWPVDPELIIPHLPPGLTLDLWQGQAWLGVVPFGMKGVGLRALPPVPTTGAFLECNVRTYVTANNKPGVFFFSLDAASKLAVRTARHGLGLPYFDAKITLDRHPDNTIAYHTTRTHSGQHPGTFTATYRPEGDIFHATPGTIDYWLCERYCLYTRKFGKTLRGEIDHAPWPLQLATAEITTNTVAHAFGFTLDTPPTHLHFAHHISVRAWTFTPL